MEPGAIFHFGTQCVRYLYLTSLTVLLIDKRAEYQRAGIRCVSMSPSDWVKSMHECHFEAHCVPPA